jgi:hypothetical protein
MLRGFGQEAKTNANSAEEYAIDATENYVINMQSP